MLAFADPDLDNGPRTDRSATMRMCAVTRQVRPIDELIRFVVVALRRGGGGSEAQASRPRVVGLGDRARRLRKRPGVTSLARASSATSASRRAWRRTPKPCWYAARSDALAMAAKAGQVVCGFSKVEGALAQRQAQALIHAADGAADGIRKLDAIARQNAGNERRIRRDSGGHGADFRTIGFGTWPVKCDTCCAARGSRRARRSCRAARSWSDTGWRMTTRQPAMRL